jgi:hypothetical protein
MNLPVYKFIKLKNNFHDDINSIFKTDLNLKSPVVFNLSDLTYEITEQIVKFIETYFKVHNLSLRFPYPVYVISKYEWIVSEISFFQNEKDLPQFFSKKDTKINLKESQLVLKTKLLQQELLSADPSSYEEKIKSYSKKHKVIYELEVERRSYQQILNHLIKENQEE